MDNSERSKT